MELSNICAIIAAPEHSVDWFIKIIGEFESIADVTDDYRHKVTSGQKYMLGHLSTKSQWQYDKWKEYPFMNFRISKSSFEISSKDFVDN